MENLDTILILMAMLAGLYSVAEKFRVPYPVVLVLGGLMIGFVPDLPLVRLSPAVVFLVFLPPLLFDAARNTSWHDFRRNRAPIGRLAIGLVLFTTVVIAVCAHYLIPGFTWPLSFVLGAIVSPPDVVAASSAIKGLRLPRRMITILEGESLVNDASALIAYRYAVAAAFSGGFVLWQAAFQFVLVAVGGLAVGLALGWIFIAVQKHLLNNSTVETSVTLVLPYVSYLLAEHLGMSGVLAVVATGLIVSWRSHEVFSYQTRMKIQHFWDVLIFMLNGLVFILIGLQLHAITSEVSTYSLPSLIVYGLLVSMITILVRIVWIYPSVYITNWLARTTGLIQKVSTDSRQLFIIGWSGMRGVVSLASALALPLTLADGAAFPQRDVILFITFIVILVTLVVQGLTLPFLVRFLKVQEPEDRIIEEERTLRLAVANSALALIEKELAATYGASVIKDAKQRFERQIEYLNGVLYGESSDQSPHENGLSKNEFLERYLRGEQALIDHQRQLIIDMHRAGSFSQQALRRIELELDAWTMNMAEKRKMLRKPRPVQ